MGLGKFGLGKLGSGQIWPGQTWVWANLASGKFGSGQTWDVIVDSGFDFAFFIVSDDFKWSLVNMVLANYCSNPFGIFQCDI